MTRAEKIGNLVAVVLPFLGLIVALALLWNHAITWIDIGLAAGMYAISAFGITIGWHRLLTHRSFQTFKPVEYAFAIAGSMAVQGSVLDWVADHRKHHAHTDAEGDPHSPHSGHGSGLRGLWYAHVGWLFDTHGQADWRKHAPDLYEDRGMRLINRHFLWIVLAGLAIPFALGWLLHGALGGALQALVWAGLVRIFFVHHITWSVNSVCHFLGSRRFDVEDRSTNVFWLALPSLGESWHHNHHAFPRSARHGLRWWEIDVSGALIGVMERLGLARDVVRISPERQRQRLAEDSRTA